MVYCGKPSRGCQMCRTRRIKCDETKPTCNQCAKSRRICPGYKDEFDLVFRNETQATERRARKANKMALAQKYGREAESGESSGSSTSPASSTDACLITATPQIPIEDQAACHFVSNFVLIPNQGNARGFMEFLIPLMKMEHIPLHFKFAFDACALASLNNRVGTGNDFKKETLGKYTRALSATFAALRDPDVAKQDATLASVLLLGLFENITARQLGMLAWGSHIEGAIQLAKVRGRKQLRTKVGLAMFIAVRTQMIIHSLSTSKAPIMGADWWMHDTVRDEHASECQRLNIIIGEFRAETNQLLAMPNRAGDHVEKVIDMIKRCQAHDLACANWSKNLPSYFQWKTVAWEDNVPNGDYAKAEVYPGRVDAYQDLWVTSVWNMMRCSRIVLASIIVRCAAWISSPVDYRTTPEYATAARTCVDTITDIIASVPYQLSWFSKRKDLLKRANFSTFGCGEEDAQKGLGGYFMTWPLACIHGQDYITDSQRIWVQGRLEYVGSQLGVRYAYMLTQLNVRVPSMLIRRDGLLASPYPQAEDFEKLLSAKTAPPSAAYATDPMQQREAMQRETIQRQTAELVSKAMGTSGKIDEWTAKTWLQLQHLTTTTI
ncbi:White-opaque regulator 1 [Tolypocladium capitatum]|uniref:White-opaque regulator 1 n=1 Tax=Tolypocladium capitatum TaxID=45235 RepID=A0A2K3QD23_9HYPO|nr:White-opaque regulator 1 [Tolypocladium capitatum]